MHITKIQIKNRIYSYDFDNLMKTKKWAIKIFYLIRKAMRIC